jgi:hypothetical protein
VTREEALALLESGSEVTLETVGDIAAAFGLSVSSPNWNTEVYAHPRCGAFIVTDYGYSVLSDQQKILLRKLLECVIFHETWG